MSHVSEWVVRIHLFDDDTTTSARAVLETGTRTLSRDGHAPNHGSPEIAAEFATSAAMEALSTELSALAGIDSAALTRTTDA